MITYWQFPDVDGTGVYFRNTETNQYFPLDPGTPGSEDTPAVPGNPQYITMQAQVAEGEAEIVPAPAPDPLPDYILKAEEDAAKVQPNPLLAALNVLGATVDVDALSDTQIYSAIILWPDWALGVDYVPGDIAVYETIVYKCVQPNSSIPGWEPPNVPALWTRYNPPGEVVEWIQPTGAQDAYPLGQRVTHVGFTWQSTVDNNVWEPGVYGWSKL